MSDSITIKVDQIIKKRNDLLIRVMDERVYIVAKEDGHPVRLNQIGTKIWQLLDTPQRASDLIAFICDQYEIDPQEAAMDLELFLTEMMHKKFIEPGNEKDENFVSHPPL